MMCYFCSDPDVENKKCYICDGEIGEIMRVPDNAQMWECEYPECNKFFINQHKLVTHITTVHGQPIDFSYFQNPIIPKTIVPSIGVPHFNPKN